MTEYISNSCLICLQSFKVPWLKIITSLPVWAIIVANVTSDWGAYTLLTNIPTYINEVLKFDITDVSKDRHLDTFLANNHPNRLIKQVCALT